MVAAANLELEFGRDAAAEPPTPRAVPSAIAVVTAGSPEKRVYASDIDIRRTVEPAAGIGSGASVRSPESGPMPPGSLVATPTDPDLFLMGDSGRRNEGCLQLCRLQRRRFSVRRRARCGACRHLVGRSRRQACPRPCRCFPVAGPHALPEFVSVRPDLQAVLRGVEGRAIRKQRQRKTLWSLLRRRRPRRGRAGVEDHLLAPLSSF